MIYLLTEGSYFQHHNKSFTFIISFIINYICIKFILTLSNLKISTVSLGDVCGKEAGVRLSTFSKARWGLAFWVSFNEPSKSLQDTFHQNPPSLRPEKRVGVRVLARYTKKLARWARSLSPNTAYIFRR